MNNDALILAIETSQAGSISLLKGSEQIDFWVGNKENSRSQDLLTEISRLLEKNGAHKKEIDLIAAATGPGSFTGVRVGVSVALGLSQALRCARIGIPTLRAMKLVDPDSDLICVVPAGKEQCYWQAFEESRVSDQIHLSNYDELEAEANKKDHYKIVSDFYLFERLKGIAESVVSAPENLAYLIGLSALTGFSQATSKSEIVPLYVRDASVRS